VRKKTRGRCFVGSASKLWEYPDQVVVGIHTHELARDEHRAEHRGDPAGGGVRDEECILEQ